ncbi:MAG: GAF domain-containing SpoIIE family protein phosphatase [Thermodesulfobacteriota bacterium]|nr:GAF domain-containing SpoIIE family protein phosphatase [Thermodesulfobacteriota bacterium]
MTKGMTQKNSKKDMHTILQIARALGITSDLDSLLKMVIDYSMELLNAERATLFLYDSEHEELYTHIAEGVEGFRISINVGFAGLAARNLKIVNCSDAYADERFNKEIDARTGYRTRNILSCPLTDYNGKLVGVLQILNKRDAPFDDADIELAEALSAQAGVALQRAKLMDEHLEKQRLENAMEIAREIQQEMLPGQSPPLEGFDIACWNRPCDATGGDFCDFVSLDKRRLMLSLGDVSGHGIGPALVSGATRAMLRALWTDNCDIEEIIRKVNRLMEDDLPDNRFITAFLGVLYSETGLLHYCSAGQAPILWLHADSGNIDILAANTFPMGILPDMGNIETQKAPMRTGDVFTLLTDGFYEWARADKEQFGIERVVKVIIANQKKNADAILKAIRTAVEKFAATKQSDDMTAIIIKKSLGPDRLGATKKGV